MREKREDDCDRTKDDREDRRKREKKKSIARVDRDVPKDEKDAIVKEFKDECPNEKPDKAKCGEFAKNEKLNRSADLPILDENRIKLQDAGYINANVIKIADFNFTLIIAQLPDPAIDGAIETFWRMIFQNSVTQLSIGYVATETSLAPAQLFPIASGAFLYFGKMFVNNKKVETIGKETLTYTLEVLPDGCSNSIMVTVYHHVNWKKGKGPAVIGDIPLVAEKMLKANDSIAFCSLNGPGRGGTMAAIFASMFAINKNNEIKVKEVVAKLRQQRYGIVETQEQYISIYAVLAQWFKSNSRDTDFTKKLDELAILKS
ncbi:unnamed protein product [Caenorhabditis bovis]|uniref:Tyrosine-protein phosphatase domain-containing protein n=1 Tax=Caenorhabditis bovis TaxID=2654633 RepID=A0A8S1F3J6_9PELO|nr:unnamed protein product [Caenorhabditis bovis]